jgi:thiamine-monophosphate kinase
MKQPNEEEIVARIERAFKAKKAGGLRLTFGDDAALWSPRAGWETVLTCDWFLEGTHFLRDKHPADAVGWKCLARAVSDIAAMGGEPRCFVLSLALPPKLAGAWLDEFLAGLRRASRALGCELAGGDTTRRNEVLISITAIGEVRRGRAVVRSGARPGDLIYVSGTLGEAELGLRRLRRRRGVAKATNGALKKHLYPRPRLELGEWLAERRLVSAMMDLSDGLSTDLARLCAASGVGARIDGDSLTLTRLTGVMDARRLALHGGDDYELLFAVRPAKADRLPKQLHGLKLTRVGEITQKKDLLVLERGKVRRLRSEGWDPFRA